MNNFWFNEGAIKKMNILPVTISVYGIGFITVFDAILMSRQTGLKCSVFMEIRCQIIFIKHRF